MTGVSYLDQSRVLLTGESVHGVVVHCVLLEEHGKPVRTEPPGHPLPPIQHVDSQYLQKEVVIGNYCVAVWLFYPRYMVFLFNVFKVRS